MKETLDFIIIGAQKAGTTSLFEHLRRHPELSLPDGKEVPFFSDEEVRRRGWGTYMRRAFAFADPSAKWGTATPQYMFGGLLDQPNPSVEGYRHDERTVPLRIREQLPDARLIAILRDPVERARSHHRMMSMEGLEQRPFDEAIRQLLRPEALDAARREPRETSGYVAWGEYGRILAGYFEVFSGEQMLVLFTDELDNVPEMLLRRVFEFLGVRDDFMPDDLGTKYRLGGAERRVSWLGNYSILNPLAFQRALTRSRAAKSLWHAMPESRRRQVDSVFGRLVYRLDLWNRRTDSETADPDSETLELLRTHFAKELELLARLIGKAPPWQSTARAA
jgi:Sulfotransferase domain